MDHPRAIPDDPALPGLSVLRNGGLAQAVPGIGLEDASVEVRLRTHVPGSRATLEARAGTRRFVVKAYADDPSSEAELYSTLSRIGLTEDSGPRAPRLGGWNRELGILVLTWLEGPSASELVRQGQGARAGQLAADWLRYVRDRAAHMGPPRGRGHMLYQAGIAAGALLAADPALGNEAKTIGRALVRTEIKEGAALVHGTLYARHIIDLGDGPGVIDWMQFGQGPLEIDAAMFLASLSRLALRHPTCAQEAGRAREQFLAQTKSLLDPHVREWYWSAALLHMAASGLKAEPRRPLAAEASALVREAARHAADATGREALAS